ncbi:hypothetical protein [Achromobacter marplatensis]|uniref:hypothetical protein n=1 Tax=Achromobacter marplatensis TaxID=470868 RepID=UPI000278172A|nr:hypothetical protein [Achromobacter marplatensis]EJO31664.1 phage tail fiber protein [Achromobacter marplatensis]
MKKIWAFIQDGLVAEITDIDPAGRFHSDFKWVECDLHVTVGDKYAGGTFSKPAVDAGAAERHLIAVVQHHMDVRARQSIYDDLKTAISYADEPASPQYQAEGRAFRAWRSRVWEAFYRIRADIASGATPPLSDKALIESLPDFESPE